MSAAPSPLDFDLRSRFGVVLEIVTLIAVGAIVTARFTTTTEGAIDGSTLWIAQLAFLAVFVWLLARYLAGSLGVRWTAVDLATLLLVLGHALGAGVVFVWGGDKRAALNLLWEWLGVGATVFLVSRLTASLPQARPWLVSIIVAVATGTAALGVWQHHAVYEQVARDYLAHEAERERLERSPRRGEPGWSREMAALEAWYVDNSIPLDEGGRRVWEQRVLHSREPFGLFSLTNTFAGLLAPALILALGWVRVGKFSVFSVQRSGAEASSDRTLNWARWIVAIAAAGLMAYCLLLTKSRTAWVGLMAGLAVWVWLLLRERRDRREGEAPAEPRTTGGARLGRSLALPVSALVLIAAAVWSGSLDRFVLSEAGKSFRYRLEWWDATWQMQTADFRRVILGVGLGNFRQHYLPYKLPQSSEEIRDPHNLVLDAWANGGILAVSGLAVLVLGVTWKGSLWRSIAPSLPQSSRQSASRTSAEEREQGHRRTPAEAISSASQQPDDAERIPLWLEPPLVSVLLGLGSVWVLGGETEQLAPVCLAASLVALGSRGQGVDRWSTAGAFAALAIHLLGAGGLGMPAISQLLLGLAVIWTTEPAVTTPAEVPPVASPRWHFGMTAFLATALIAGGFWNLSVVTSAKAGLSLGNYALYRQRQPRLADKAYSEAAAADPYSPEPWQQKALVAFSMSQLVGDSEAVQIAFDQAVRYQTEALARDPRNHTATRALAQMYRRRYAQSRKPADAAETVRWMRRTAALYPTRASLLAELAEAASLVEPTEESWFAAGRAIELHEINRRAGHPDKQLPEAVLKRMEGIRAARSASS